MLRLRSVQFPSCPGRPAQTFRGLNVSEKRIKRPPLTQKRAQTRRAGGFRGLWAGGEVRGFYALCPATPQNARHGFQAVQTAASGASDRENLNIETLVGGANSDNQGS